MADAPRKFQVVGTPAAKVDGGAKVTGQTLFADDLVLPRMLHCKLHRSRHAHAKIIRVDTRRASALPGVIAVLTGDALPIPFGILPSRRTSTRSARTSRASWAIRSRRSPLPTR